MHLGQVSFRVTGLLASGRRRRKLRRDLKVTPQVIGAETTFVIKIPGTGVYMRFPEFEWEVLTCFDGSRTDRDVLEELQGRYSDLEMTVTELENFADSAHPDIWEKTLTEKNLALLEKIRSERQERAREQSIFYMFFSAFDPNNFFNRIIPYLRWLWTRPFVIVSIGLFLLGLVLFVIDFDRIVQDTIQFYSFRGKGLLDIADLWILILIIGFIHECAHGLTCKNFGGDVHQMGFLLMYFTPAFYTDVSDMYLFDKDYKRQWTIFAGIWVEGVICSFSLIVWSLTTPGAWVNEWAYKWVLITSITGVLLNLNPLMKFDGYYALCQALKVDNLREDSFAYLGQWVRHFLSGGREPVEGVSRRKHRIYLTYAILANLYTALVLLVVLVWAKNVAISAFGFWGWVLIGGLVWLVLRKRVAGILQLLRNWARTGKEAVMRWRKSWQASVVAAAAVLLVVVPTTQVKVTSDFVLEPGDLAEVRTPVPGVIQEIRVNEGQRVEQGMLLGVLHNPEIEAQERILQRELQLAEQTLRAAQARGDLAQSQQHARERERLAKEWQEARQKKVNLYLLAPLDGLVITPQIAQRVGEYLHEGQPLCTVVNRSRMRARVLVRDSDLEDIQLGAQVKLKVRPYPLETFAGRVEQILPAAAADRPVAQPTKAERHGQELFNYFAVTLEFPTSEERLREGMTGTAKIYGPRSSLAWRAARSVWRWWRSQVWF